MNEHSDLLDQARKLDMVIVLFVDPKGRFVKIPISQELLNKETAAFVGESLVTVYRDALEDLESDPRTEEELRQ